MKKWYAVIGDPISHSKSPAMHEAWFAENDIDAAYIPIHVPSGTVAGAVDALRRLGASGWNVTIPHKQAIIPYLDEVDPLAAAMQAVNTVKVLPDGRLLGMNTDGPGFVRSLEERIGSFRKKERVLVIGAGGAANGIALAMNQAGYGKISVCNRTVQKAEALCGRIGGEALSLEDAAEKLDEFGVIIQTTPVGMSTATGGLPIAIERLDPGAVVADIVYSPLHTDFLKAAMKNGNEIVDGLGMFIWQGALAFHEWTGRMPDTLGTRQRLIAEMEESTC
ncbi:shikimate dehydrogenase [Bhargavaea beijingensis]|uniref:Shikimate dehydrogenase (NADP(+)) n=1 Tax=Bhargavaea beijingensis TaxID=426756 RepID=A0A1G7CNB4_9BACL|nr:shikimate dehydrogenase [Bhargavaea beijingensis]MCW1927054.1 shikimate dehydrogenase [Bhargavaea beijingensis]RSK30784.1 shikimate dehydrogenase [Bhargavaea beijingensis]SDE40812.1 shikimate dehydrogenase [Bhargavaea beijingensis]